MPHLPHTGAESFQRQHRAGRTAAPDAAGDDGQRRQRADDNGIDKDFQYAVHA